MDLLKKIVFVLLTIIAIPFIIWGIGLLIMALLFLGAGFTLLACREELSEWDMQALAKEVKYRLNGC